MSSRIVAVILIVLLAAIHVQLWTGRGGLPTVAALERKLDNQKAANAKAKLVNDQLASEVQDLRSGLGTVEEKARLELGMVKQGEIFVQITPPRPPSGKP
jgi:cell division protein FtsB